MTVYQVKKMTHRQFGLPELFIITSLVAVSLSVGLLFHAGWGAFTLIYALVIYRSVRQPLGLISTFTVWHFRVLLGMWLVFSLLTFYILSRGLDDAPNRLPLVFWTSAASISGPFTGAISRGFQGCCLDFSIWLVPYCATGFGISLLVHVLSTSSSLWIRVVRLFTWAAGLFLWFAGGIVSFGHALS